jgi:hypothetical protein
MVLTRQEKEKKILDLYNEGKTYKQIAEIVRVSLRAINPVLKKAEKEREGELGINTQEGDTKNNHTQRTSASSQAYCLFSEGKTPLDVAIELNLKERDVTKYYREYWKLRQLYSLNIVYEEIGDNIIHIPKIHRKIRAAGMGVDQAINLIKNANNDLSVLEQKYEQLKKDVNLLESQKFKESGILHDLEDRITDSKRMLKRLETSCQEKEANINQLLSEKIRLKGLVKQFKDNDEEYLKIERTVQNKITNILLDGKDFVKFALYSLMESMRADPRKYTNLIYYNRNSSARNIDWQYTGYNYIHGQQPYTSFNDFYEEYKSTLLEEAQKLYNKSVKEWTEQIITDHPVKNSSSQLFMPNKERRQQSYHKPSSLPILISYNQAYPFKRVKRLFIKTEF